MLRGFWKWFNNARAIVLAVAVHLIVLAILVVNMEWLDVKPASSPKASPIQTKTVDRKLIEKRLARIEQEKKQKEAAKKRKQLQAEKEKRRLAELEKKRKAEAKRKKDLAVKQKREAKRKKEVEIKRKKELAAKKKRDAEVKKQAEAKALKKKKLAEQKVAAEKKRKQEALKKKQAAEAKKKRIAEEQRRLDSLEKQRRQKIMEEGMLQALEDEENESKIAQIIGLIEADVQNNWRIPPTVRKGMQCVMLIRLLPSGDVQTVQITRSSGDKAFDRAAEDAVFRASPLPVSLSSAGKLFNSTFREFNFRFAPRNL
jgi:colicin import membrane protein